MRSLLGCELGDPSFPDQWAAQSAVVPGVVAACLQQLELLLSSTPMVGTHPAFPPSHCFIISTPLARYPHPRVPPPPPPP